MARPKLPRHGIQACGLATQVRLATQVMVVMLGCPAWCGKPAPPPEPPPPPRLEIRAEAAPTINRDAAGHPLSVVVRVYQLKDKGEFSKLTFDLAASGRPGPELLGQEYLAATEFTLVPGAMHKGLEPLQPETRFLGVAAAFRHPDAHLWRCLAWLDLPAPAPPPQAVAPPRKPSFFKRAFTKKKQPDPPPPNPLLSFTVQDCYLQLQRPAAEPLPGQPANPRPDCGCEGVWGPGAGGFQAELAVGR